MEPKSASYLKLEADNCEKTSGYAPIATFLLNVEKVGMDTQMAKARSLYPLIKLGRRQVCDGANCSRVQINKGFRPGVACQASPNQYGQCRVAYAKIVGLSPAT